MSACRGLRDPPAEARPGPLYWRHDETFQGCCGPLPGAARQRDCGRGVRWPAPRPSGAAGPGARARAGAAAAAPAVVSFEPLPRAFFSAEPVPRLSSVREKLRGFAAAGMEQTLLLRFNRALTAMSAEDFVQQVLVDRLAAREVWVGARFPLWPQARRRCGAARADGRVTGLHRLHHAGGAARWRARVGQPRAGPAGGRRISARSSPCWGGRS